MSSLKKILVTGGAGYIGSHTIVELLMSRPGCEVISIDNFSNPNTLRDMMQRVKAVTGREVKNYAIDICDMKELRGVFEANPGIDGVIHFAAFKSVPESVADPQKYFNNNIGSLENILECLKLYGVKNFIFSSSCSVYGDSKLVRVDEESPLGKAASPYAETKQKGEEAVKKFSAANQGIASISLRYFNPVGAYVSEKGSIGESSKLTSNLVPIIVSVAAGRRKELVVYGTDYDTTDGTCIRDYIHVSDIASAHVAALEYLAAGKAFSNYSVINLGTGNGVSVLEAIAAFEKATGQKLNYSMGPRRDGDVPAVYSVNRKAVELLGWNPKHSLEDMMRTAWTWEQSSS